jgi:hypothetical protein
LNRVQEAGKQRPEARDKKPEIRRKRPETRSQEPETRNKKNRKVTSLDGWNVKNNACEKYDRTA